MRQPAARRVRAGRIDCHAPFFNAGNLAVLIHYKRRAVRDAQRLDQNPVFLRDLAHVIAEHGIADVEFLLPVRQGGREIGADRQNLSAIRFKLVDTRLVCVQFLGSTTGKCSDEEGQYNGLLAAKIGQLDGLVVRVGKGEVGSHVPDLESSLGRIETRRLRGKRRRQGHARQ